MDHFENVVCCALKCENILVGTWNVFSTRASRSMSLKVVVVLVVVLVVLGTH